MRKNDEIRSKIEDLKIKIEGALSLGNTARASKYEHDIKLLEWVLENE